MIYLKIVVALLGFVIALNAKTYDGYKVYSVVPKYEAQVQILNDLRKSDYSFDFWTDLFEIGSDVRIMVAPEKEMGFLKYSKSVGLDATLRIENVQDLIDAQMQPSQSTERATLGSFTWTHYHPLEEIYAWLDELKELYPDVVTLKTIGTSYEGRDIRGIIIDFKPDQRSDKPLIGMIEGGIHAREWISPATVTWIIKEFLTSTDSTVRSMAEAFVWHIFPVVNPDGYTYTFTDTRMWRKNRNPTNYVNCSADSDIGNGIDLNRNFDFFWMTVSASSNPCSNNYAGPSPSSELETKAISDHVRLLTSQGNFIYYIAFHSFYQMILVPFSHVTGTDVLEADNYGDMVFGHEIDTNEFSKDCIGTPNTAVT
ncbi:zinc carboxypeptidase-like [Hyposmocoma kahamanoa]|uniref:zinc carboxypeptidase-like n=1 Tax=Hyposmocoma kahamanoa TaxID=1477025 RepID=UPI000E6D9114|nr:zinc carboxypeptidase-like [Hyposmocoma kahamanoa]